MAVHDPRWEYGGPVLVNSSGIIAPAWAYGGPSLDHEIAATGPLWEYGGPMPIESAGRVVAPGWEFGGPYVVHNTEDERAVFKIINEVLRLTEVVGKGQASTKTVNETIRISESCTKRGVVRKIVDEVLNIAEGILRLIGWRETLAGDSPIALDMEGDSAITTTLSGYSLLED